MRRYRRQPLSLWLFSLASLLFVGTGCGFPSFLITPVSSSNTLKEDTVQGGSRSEKIAIIEVEGLLLNARTGGFLQAKENDVSLFIQQLEVAEKDPKVKAVVLRINSPGGTVSASDVMYDAVLKFRQKTKKPVVASAQDVAASGAYYVACAADQIVVQPTSVIGSIGVIFQTFDFSGTLDKIGAKSVAIKSGPLKDMGSPFKPLEDNERRVMQAMVNEYHLRFRSVVKLNRQMSDERVDQVADGGVFSGVRAVDMGLADQAGLLPEAITLAKKLANADNARVIMYRRPYGYSGSIYASSPNPNPAPVAAQNVEVNLLPAGGVLDAGFYYIWMPGVSPKGIR